MTGPLRAAAPDDALVDALGVRHAPAGDDARIACLVPSITETLFALGLADRVVARTGYCIHPRDAVERVPKVGGTKTVNLAKLRRLAPTHVIVNVDENRREDVDALRSFVPHIVVTHPRAPDDNPALYRLLGALFGRSHEAHAAVTRFEAARVAARMAASTHAFTPRRVLYLIWRDPWMTVSRDTYVSRMLAEVAWHTHPHDSEVRYPRIALDAATRDAIDLVLLSSEPYPFTAHDAQALAATLGLPVRCIDGELASWYGTRAIRALQTLPAVRAEIEASLR